MVHAGRRDGEAKPWLEALKLVDRRAGVGARSHALCDARRRSVGDRPRARAGQAGHVHDGAAVHGPVSRRGRRLVEERHQRLHRSGERARCGARTARRCSSARSTTRPTTKRSIATRSPIRSSSRSCAAKSRSGGCSRPRPVSSRRSRPRRGRPICGCSAPSGQRTRITNLNPQLARFTFQQAGAVLLRQRRRRSAGRAALQAGRPRRRTTRCRSSPGSTRS